MADSHQRYPNPTIAEAICDIRFRIKEWKLSLPGEFFKYIQDEYPEMEPISAIGLQLEFGPTGAGTKIIPQSQRVRFKHKNRALILQLAENNFTINTLSPYPGWETVRKDALVAWQKLEAVLRPDAITRIGLRYINRFEKETERDYPGNWLTTTDYIPSGVLRSEPGFLSRTQVRFNTHDLLIVTLGDFKPNVGGGYGSIVFDIDRVTEQEVVSGLGSLEEELDRLHADVWEVFSSAEGQKLRDLLNRR